MHILSGHPNTVARANFEVGLVARTRGQNQVHNVGMSGKPAHNESPFAPLGSGTLVWQSGITRSQSQGIKTREPRARLAVVGAIFGNQTGLVSGQRLSHHAQQLIWPHQRLQHQGARADWKFGLNVTLFLLAKQHGKNDEVEPARTQLFIEVLRRGDYGVITARYKQRPASLQQADICSNCQNSIPRNRGLAQIR
jgi:hypothetical protein